MLPAHGALQKSLNVGWAECLGSLHRTEMDYPHGVGSELDPIVEASHSAVRQRVTHKRVRVHLSGNGVRLWRGGAETELVTGHIDSYRYVMIPAGAIYGLLYGSRVINIASVILVLSSLAVCVAGDSG